MDAATIVAAVTGAFAGTAFPAAVAWRFIGILTTDLRSVRDELRALRVELAKMHGTAAPSGSLEGGPA